MATATGQIGAENLAPEFLAVLTKGITVLAIGPGLGQSPEDGKICHGLLAGDQDAGGDRRGCAQHFGGQAGCCWRSWPRDARWC